MESSLTAFEQEGIQNITQYKDSLLSKDPQHKKKNEIEKKHDHLLKLWNNLLGLAEARKHRLLNTQNQLKEVEDLFLSFAKKASAFNSWFENAEEDLTDPVLFRTIFVRLFFKFGFNFCRFVAIR